jgi:hypothetical protein
MDFKDYAKLMKQSRDSDPAQFDKDMAEDRRASERRAKVEARYDRMLSRAAGRAANADSEGGMKPGQSPSLENPLRQAKGGKVKAEGMAKGGMTAKGWGKARGARAAKVY